MNRWTKISVTWDIVNSAYKVFVDGVLVKSGSISGMTLLNSVFWVGAYWTNAGSEAEALIENLRIDNVAKTEEQIRAFHELQVPFFDPDPNTSPAPVIDFNNTDHVYAVSPKDNLQPQGTVTITKGSATVQGLGSEFTKMYAVGEEIEFLETSNGDVHYEIQSITDDDTLVLTANIAEVTASGISYRNYTLKDIVDLVEPLKFIKKTRTY